MAAGPGYQGGGHLHLGEVIPAMDDRGGRPLVLDAIDGR
jgi:hypothetical protein